MKDIKELLVAGKKVEITHRLAHTPDKSFTEKDGYVEKSYVTVIDFVEEREDYYYIGHKPVDIRNGRFGCFRLMKNQDKRFGVVAIKEV